MQKIRRDIGKVLKDLTVPATNQRVPKKHTSPDNMNRSSGNVTKAKKVDGKLHTADTHTSDKLQAALEKQDENKGENAETIVETHNAERIKETSDKYDTYTELEHISDDLVDEISDKLNTELEKANLDKAELPVDVFSTTGEKLNDSDETEQSEDFEKQKIVLGWSDYCMEREKLSRWLVPWEDKPSIGRYTLIVQSLNTTTKIIRETMPTRNNFPEDYFENTTVMLSKEEYIEELDRLLAFMTEHDHQATLDKYKAMLFATDNEFDMMEALGTPQKLAVNLAKDYMPSSSNIEQVSTPDSDTESKESDEVSVKANETIKDDDNKDTEFEREATKEITQTKFRSIAASNHTKVSENKSDSDLTMFVDMSQDELPDQEDDSLHASNEAIPQLWLSATGKADSYRDELSATVELQSDIENQDTKSEKKAKKVFPKSVPVFILFAILPSMIAFCLILIVTASLAIAGGAMVTIPIETLISLYTTFAIQDIVFLIGVILVSLGVGGALLLSAFLFLKQSLKKLFRWIRTGVKKRRAKKLEADIDEETE